ncbi:hypothetical protein PpBr36_01155 [Pyricularia pennisetigena]|uniref:hypothetical protein n=1 Tax=Pyricularia pennisetigena TaxID=1578925 RepID=UPI0011501DA0|nr:hypothetical protein PpBr36_01155 [Pyricularia pennisetigena]TLS29349.1 hypothetical protein PpBr36_01155 [Pyricularia pennisetigena]
MPQSKVPRLGRLGPRLARPFYTSMLISASLATYALLRNRAASPEQSPLIHRRKEDIDCRLVHQAEDQCAFVLANCQDEEAGLLPYLALYYCNLGGAQPVAFGLLAAWLALLFTTIGIAASDFFSINLSTIASILGLSESLAGVTFLAFGNGSPDVFSTFAAMGSNSGSMAVGELIGAAGFITAVVAGSMALVREFKVVKRTFVRDICFFILAASFAMAVLADGHLHFWECIIMVAFYIFYVMVVVGWHWWVTRRKRQWQKEAAARGHFYGANTQPADELEPYRDNDEEGEDSGTMGRDRLAESAPDISALERAPRIEVDDVEAEQDDEVNLDRDMFVAAEMTSSMRVNRPRGPRSRSYTTLAQIRPSFVGALEFRSVLASLQNSGNVRLASMHSRRQSEALLNSQEGRPRLSETASHNALGLTSTDDTSASPGRDRARSHGALPSVWTFPGPSSAPRIVTESPTSPMIRPTSKNSLPPPSRSSTTKDGRLAPPSEWHEFFPPGTNVAEGTPSIPPGSPMTLRLQIPGSQTHSSGQSSPSLSPFPGLSDSPLLLTPISGLPINQISTPAIDNPGYFGGDIQEECAKPVRWWPYSVLPPPHVFLRTLFPTLQGWATKSVWDKFVSIISAPSILLLVITLPVVETERLEEDPDLAGPPTIEDEVGHPTGVPACAEPVSSVDRPETEWQRYRRNTRSRSISPYSALATPGNPFESSSLNPTSTTNGMPRTNSLSLQPNKPGEQTPLLVQDNEAHETEEESGWNRWLVAIQIFTGPLFTVLIVWANMADDLEKPTKTLIRFVLYSLLGSLVLLALLLLSTSPNVRPRYHFLFCFLGFVISVAWISTVAGEVVGVLKAFGVILGISEAILGLTIFAVGNSLGDLVADITVARLGYPVMALAACFGGPMLNILLGIGIGGAWMTTKTANERHHNHPDKPLKYKPYHIQVGGTLMISAVTLLLTLVFLLIVVPLNNWVMSRKIGWSLIVIWSVSTVVNLIFEATGTWSEVA